MMQKRIFMNMESDVSKSDVSIRVVFDRAKKANRKIQGLVQIECRVGKSKKYFSTGVRCFPSQWERYSCRVRGTAEDNFCNEKIENTFKAIYAAYDELKSHNKEITTESIKTAYNAPKVPKSGNFIDYIIETVREQNIAERTKALRFTAVAQLREFGRIVCFSDLTRENIECFDSFLHRKNLKQTTVHLYHAIIKTCVKCAMRDGLVKNNPYEWVKIPRGRTEMRKYLTHEELEVLKNYKPKKQRYKIAKDLFMMQCYTGMAYVDLTKTDFTKLENHNGKYVLRDRRQKTNTDYYIVVLASAMEILKRYKYCLPKMEIHNYLFYLGEIAKQTGITHLSSHMGRHTFAVMCLKAGVSIEVLARMMGHTDIKTTQIYAKVLDSSVESGFDKLSEVL